MFKQIVLFALAIASVSSANLPFTDCGSISQVLAFRLEGCDAVPCTIYRGSKYFGDVEVISAAPTPTLPFEIQAILGFPYPPFQLSSGDACHNLAEGSCPTSVGQAITAQYNMDVPATMPTVTTSLRTIIRDDLDQVQVCVQILVTLV